MRSVKEPLEQNGSTTDSKENINFRIKYVPVTHLKSRCGGKWTWIYGGHDLFEKALSQPYRRPGVPERSESCRPNPHPALTTRARLYWRKHALLKR